MDYDLDSMTVQGRNWTAINRANQESNRAHRRLLGGLQTINEVRRRQTLASNGNFPFRIYNPHPSQLPAGFDMTTLWQTFLVRGGEIDGTPLQNPNGGGPCDGFDQNPDDDYYPQDDDDDDGNPVQPILCSGSDDNPFYFWSDTTTDKTNNPQGNPIIKFGNGTPQNWANFPSPTANQILIGWVDTTTTPNQAIIRQILRSDYFTPGSSALTRAQIVGEQDNTITVKIYKDATNLQSAITTVAKPYELRRTTYDGTTNMYGAVLGYLSKNTRSNSSPQANGDIINPPYTVGADIYIAQCSNAINVFNGATAATYVDADTDGRAFDTEVSWCGGQYTLMKSGFYTASLL